MRNLTRLTGIALAAGIAAALFAAAPSQADEAPAPAAVVAEPELMGQAVYEWCDYTAKTKTAIHKEARTNSDTAGYLNGGSKIKSKCGADGLVDGGRYTVCGGGTKWRQFTDDSFWRNYRFVPATCLDYMY